MKLVTSNIMGNPKMPYYRAKADIYRTFGKAENSDGVILWQEISNHDYKDALEEATQAHLGWRTLFLDFSVPISYDANTWVKIDDGIIKLHGGRVLTSPARYLTWVVLRNAFTGLEILVINLHFVSGAWNNKNKIGKKWRQKKWLHSWNVTQQFIHEAHKRFPNAVPVGGGDHNRTDVRAFAEHQRTYGTGIIKLWVIPPKGQRWHLAGQGNDSDNFSDHPIKWIRGQVVKENRRNFVK